MSLIENVRFWINQFDQYWLNVEQQGLLETEHVSSEDAAQRLISSIYSEFQPAAIRRAIRDWTLPRNSMGTSFPKEEIEKIIINFRNMNLTPGPIDIVAIIFETTGKIIHHDFQIESVSGNFSQEIVAYRSIYPAAKAARNTKNDVKMISDTAEDALARIQATTKEQLSNLQRSISMKNEEIFNITENRIDKKCREIIENLENNSVLLISQAKDEFKASFVLETAMNLWKTKARSHTRLFFLGASIFAVAILGPLATLLFEWRYVVAEFANLIPKDQSFAFGGLLIVTIPVLGYAWILRLISRFTISNMMLADDASQRRVLANTYIRLVGQGAANDEHDRAIMLNALFRALPGSKEQDLQPPNLTDFIKAKP
ncbi:DUF6161 domain-containing protein [uncultured Roseibium sp.]|uniref:DUF6161 domain-containing protein n=1 Tax=uncultured Roseibium sp. TaxID=1936171 RepID=UPI002626FD29|nr:DUF6161 domain-containing protein [uncultured Roseibium sp.]